MSFSIPAAGKTLFRGDTIVIEGTVSQGGVPVNLTGYSIWFTAKKAITDADNATGAIQKTVGAGVEIVDAPNGQIRITLAPSDTATITQTTTYQCDVQLKAAGVTSTPDKGTMTVEIDITQAT